MVTSKTNKDIANEIESKKSIKIVGTGAIIMSSTPIPMMTSMISFCLNSSLKNFDIVSQNEVDHG